MDQRAMSKSGEGLFPQSLPISLTFVWWEAKTFTNELKLGSWVSFRQFLSQFSQGLMIGNFMLILGEKLLDHGNLSYLMDSQDTQYIIYSMISIYIGIRLHMWGPLGYIEINSVTQCYTLKVSKVSEESHHSSIYTQCYNHITTLLWLLTSHVLNSWL